MAQGATSPWAARGLFAGSDCGAEGAAVMYSLIGSNDMEPQACVADALAPVAATPQNRLPELLP